MLHKWRHAIASSAEERPLGSLLDEAVDSAEDGQVKFGLLLDAVGNRSFGPLLAIFGLIAAVPPIGGIPGIPSSMGLLTVLLASQILVGRSSPWLPDFIRKRRFAKDKVESARGKTQGITRRIDKLVGRRLTWATGRTGERLAAVCCIALGLLMMPLELLPFAAAVPAAGVVMFGLALTARDGLLMLLGSTLALGALGFALQHYLF